MSTAQTTARDWPKALDTRVTEALRLRHLSVTTRAEVAIAHILKHLGVPA